MTGQYLQSVGSNRDLCIAEFIIWSLLVYDVKFRWDCSELKSRAEFCKSDKLSFSNQDKMLQISKAVHWQGENLLEGFSASPDQPGGITHFIKVQSF